MTQPKLHHDPWVKSVREEAAVRHDTVHFYQRLEHAALVLFILQCKEASGVLYIRFWMYSHFGLTGCSVLGFIHGFCVPRISFWCWCFSFRFTSIFMGGGGGMV